MFTRILDALRRRRTAAARQHLLQLRGDYERNRAEYLKQLHAQQVALPTEQVQVILQPQIESFQEQIHSLQSRAQQSTDEAEQTHINHLIHIYQQNIELCQQMLRGERQFAPLELINGIIACEEQMKEIDARIARL